MIQLKGKLYDRLKFLALVVLPAAATLYFALGGIWGLPAVHQVVNTIVAVDTFLGTILQLSSNAYSKGVEQGGELHVNKGQLLFQLDEDKTDIAKLGDKSEVRFKVVKKQEPEKER
jgi:hypothetical protein